MAGGAVSCEEGEEGEEGEGDVWWRWMGGEKRSKAVGHGGRCLGVVRGVCVGGGQ